jgi:CHAD domain-containing protein
MRSQIAGSISPQRGGFDPRSGDWNPSTRDQFEAFPMEALKENTLPSGAGPANVLEKKSEVAQPRDEWSKVRKLALRQLNRFVSLESKVLKGDDPDAIHDMRVASRRLQQMFDLIFSKPLPREARRLRVKIRRCRRALGDVRNCDVLLQQVEGRLSRKHCSHREAWIAVKREIKERRSKSFSMAIRKLSKVNLAVFYMRTKEILDQLRSTPDQVLDPHPLVEAGGPALVPFPARIAQALAGVWSEFEKQVAFSHREPTAPAIHGARICAKRLRYLLEVVNQFGIQGSSDALTWLRKIQQHLGDWHDMEVLEEMVIRMIAKPELLREQLPLAMATGKLILRNRTVKQGFKEKYFQMTLESPEYQRVKNWTESFLAAPATAFARP